MPLMRRVHAVYSFIRRVYARFLVARRVHTISFVSRRVHAMLSYKAGADEIICPGATTCGVEL